MALTGSKLRAVVNLLSDPLQAHAAAHRLTIEAKERGLLISDLIQEALAPVSPPPRPPPPPPRPAQTAPPDFDDEIEDDIGVGPIGRPVGASNFGLQSFVLRETSRAWLVESPNGGETWLPKSQCEDHGRDPTGRTILIVPMWLARKKDLL